MGQGWITSPGDKYGGGLTTATPAATPDATAVTSVAPVVRPPLSGMVNPGEPMFWFAVLAAGTFGLMAYSTVQVG